MCVCVCVGVPSVYFAKLMSNLTLSQCCQRLLYVFACQYVRADRIWSLCSAALQNTCYSGAKSMAIPYLRRVCCCSGVVQLQMWLGKELQAVAIQVESNYGGRQGKG